MSTIELMIAEQASQYTGKTLTELAEAIRSVGGKPEHIQYSSDTWYRWGDIDKLRHRAPGQPQPRKARKSPPVQPATPEPVVAPPAEDDTEPPKPRKRASRTKAPDTAAQSEPAAPTSTLLEHAKNDAIPPYILDPDKLVAQLSQYGKGTLIELAKQAGLAGPFGFRRAQIARDIVVRQAEQWRAEHPNTEVSEPADELAERRKTKAAALPRRVRGATRATTSVVPPAFTDGRK